MNGRPFQNLLVVLLAIASLATTVLLVLTVIRRNQSPAPPTQALSPAQDLRLALPDFELTERSGETVTLDSLKGRVWIANFIFTRCAGPCPLVSAAMAKLQKDLENHPRRDDIVLVTFTVDPTYDTPQVLRDYAAGFAADAAKWLFLTGDREVMWRLVEDGFKLPVFDNADDPLMPIGHSLKFVLVDQRGDIRGYFHGVPQQLPDGTTLPHERDALLAAVNHLLSEP